MLKLGWLPVLIVLCGLISCGDANTKTDTPTATIVKPAFETFKTGVLLDIIGKSEQALKYSLYLPEGYTPQVKIPLFCLLDAHARTHSSVLQYQKICDNLHVAMICSGNSHNGLEVSTTNMIVQKLLDDAMCRIHTDSAHIILVGFSGGARVSGAAAAIDRRIKGVIACAAGFDAASAPNMPYVLIAGIKDMNSAELFYLHKSLTAPNGYMLWDGIHAWPPDSIMYRAMNAQLKGNVNSLTDDSKLNSIFTKQALDEESTKQSQIKSLFQRGDWDDLLTQINMYKNNSVTSPDKSIKALNQRLLAACGMYSYFSVANAPDKSKVLQVYAAADPNNPDMWFFKAVEAAKTNKTLAKTYLQKACAAGFYDIDRLMGEPLLSDIKDDDILNKVRENN